MSTSSGRCVSSAHACVLASAARVSWETTKLGWTAMASTIMEEMVEDGFPLDAKTYGQAIKVGAGLLNSSVVIAGNDIGISLSSHPVAFLRNIHY